MATPKKFRTRFGQDLSPLPAEVAANLQTQVAVVAAAVEAGRNLESLKGLVKTDPENLLWDLHLMAALGSLSAPAMPALLAALFGSSPDKARRKALKRVLHLLQTRGVPVPAELLPREEPGFKTARPAVVKSLVSPILGSGDCYLILQAPKDILGGNFLVARLHDGLGLQEVHLLNLKSRQEKELWEHYAQHGMTEWFPVPGPYAVRLLEEAYGQQAATAAAKGTYGGVRDKVWKNWGRPEEAPDPEQELPAIAAGERSRLLELSRQLATHPLFHTWMPRLEEIIPWLEKLREVQESPLILSDQQKQVRTDALVEEATRALYRPEARPLWRRRLLTMAYYLHLGQHPEEARQARAAADDLAETERSSLAGENPFMQSLVQVGLRLAWEFSPKPQEAQGESGLLPQPGEPRLLRR